MIDQVVIRMTNKTRYMCFDHSMQQLKSIGVIQRKSKGNEWLGPPINNPDPSTKIVDTRGGRRRPRSAAPTPNRPRTSEPVPTEDVGDLCGRVGVPGRFRVWATNRRPQPLHRCRQYPQRTLATSVEGSGSPIYSGLGPPIGNLDPSIEVTGVLCGYQRSRWRGRGRRLTALTPESIGDLRVRIPGRFGVEAANR
ncbi:hypothetical protein CRG98_034202 [Punica granatum]|uniref:Uncharacterized protein n=1 Tax=Punica granatum TaxID=22663 RepID=A0A2I0IN25_PUNGR|nr:hypothetical protein CRG98_034202 [Punica granatum]